jgi:hypothetical protein
LNKRFWQKAEDKTRENDRRQEKQRAEAGELDSLESANPLLLVLRHDVGKLPAGIVIHFPYDVAIRLLHLRGCAVPVASFEAQPHLVIEEADLQYTNLPSHLLPL